MPTAPLESLRSLAKLNRKQTARVSGHEGFLRELRAVCPKPGTDYVKAIMVVVREKDSIPEHFHPEHTILFYVEPAGVPIVIEGKPYLPEAGECVYLPPNVRHSVPSNPSESERISIAMLVDV